jgi:hypothetical protein
MKKARGTVYVVEAIGTGMVKVGFTTDLPTRLRVFKSCCPFGARVLKTYEGNTDKEDELHERWKAHWVHGEWFRLEPLLADLKIEPVEVPPLLERVLTSEDVEDYLNKVLPSSPTTRLVVPPAASKTAFLNLRLTQVEFSALKDYALAHGLSLSDASRSLLLSGLNTS